MIDRVLDGSSRPEVIFQKGVPKNFEKFTGKHLCQSLFFQVFPQEFTSLLLSTYGGCFCPRYTFDLKSVPGDYIENETLSCKQSLAKIDTTVYLDQEMRQRNTKPVTFVPFSVLTLWQKRYNNSFDRKIMLLNFGNGNLSLFLSEKYFHLKTIIKI